MGESGEMMGRGSPQAKQAAIPFHLDALRAGRESVPLPESAVERAELVELVEERCDLSARPTAGCHSGREGLYKPRCFFGRFYREMLLRKSILHWGTALPVAPI